ncbi:TatD family hydrolase [Lactococcus termiticola]|uniref:TatD family hydrolase n=1 Tax=Lactococcus termiticola TaxID=2169526 RepID=A0A2R5HFX3_9LACT|nr:TatD family hydrolase [Lactococcus termiticola]GBG96963.1 TatD family hydrolase [Lactococcus termiticola]
MKIFDSHTHLNDKPFLHREAEEIQKAAELSVVKMNVVGSNFELNDKAIELAHKFPEVYATIGWHPDDAGQFDDKAESYLKEKLKQTKVIALGEIGLDYHWMVESKDRQEEVFRRQIQLSKEAGVPFQVHTRDALADTYDIIKSEGVGPAGAIMHSFSGSYDDAEAFAELGMMISFSGVVSFKKATDIQEAAGRLPLDRILVETDAPYLTPVPFRGKENTPGYTHYVVQKLAEIRGISVEEVAEATYQNSLKIFGLED